MMYGLAAAVGLITIFFGIIYNYNYDSRISLWTFFSIQLTTHRQKSWHKPMARDFKIPVDQVALVKVQLPNTGNITELTVPVHDEDWPDVPKDVAKLSYFLRKSFPLSDDFSDNNKWHENEDEERYVMSKVGHIWPKVLVPWNDKTSDHALKMFVFYGLGQHRVTKLTKKEDDGSYYVLATNFMDSLDIRNGFAKYGADAFFDKDGNPVKIIRQNKTFRPIDGNAWEYAKLTFRGSLQTLVTAVDHLVGVHMIASNRFVTASREALSPNHPLRRLIKPFTFRSVAINYGAGNSLFSHDGFLHRAFALTDKGMYQAWEYAIRIHKYETFADNMKQRSIDTIKMPFDEDGLDYWNIVHKFVSGYISLYYKQPSASGADSCSSDHDVNLFIRHLKTNTPAAHKSLPEKATCSELINFITFSIFAVSGLHNHLGSIAEYVSDPRFTPPSWVEGELAARPSHAVILALIMALTGFKQPAITEDFSHLMLDDKAKSLVTNFTAELWKLAEIVDKRNLQRPQAYQSFNPKFIEMAVSI